MTREQPHSHRRTRRRIDRIFSDRLDPSLYPGLIKEIDSCTPCTDYYHRMQTLESAFCDVSDSVTPFALDRVEARVLDKANALPHARPQFLRWWGLGLAGTLALVLLMWALLPITPNTNRVAVPKGVEMVPLELSARGDGDPRLSHSGIRVFQVRTDPGRVRESKKLALTDVITFTYTRVAGKTGYLLLFGLQHTGEVLWYYPDYGEQQSIRIKGDTIDKPLGDGIDLSLNHQAGWLRIVAVFSDTPIRVADIESRVSGLKEKNTDLRNIPTLVERDHDGSILEHRVLLNIFGKTE